MASVSTRSHDLLFPLLFFLSFAIHRKAVVHGSDELRALMELKASLDPENRLLASWTSDGKPCRGDFEGVACDGSGKVVNISLQGKGLSGSIAPAVAELQGLTGLYLHFNNISGEIPREIVNLTSLSDLYLNVNSLSGSIPEELGNMDGLQVLQLSNNKLTGSIPPKLGLLKNLNMLALQTNYLNGAIPATLGDLTELTRLDLSFNQLFGSIPLKLSLLPQLEVLDVQNNSLSGNVPPELKRLGGKFVYGNNTDLCGAGFTDLRACTSADLLNASRPEPFSAGLTPQDIPQSVNISADCTTTHCSSSPKSNNLAVVVATTLAAFGVMVFGLLTFFWFRRRQQKIGSLFEVSNSLPNADSTKFSNGRSASPLISVEYSNRWDPMTDERTGIGSPQEVSQIYRFNLEEVECATQYFSEVNLLGKKSGFAATYKGILRDGTEVAVKRINKTSCKSEEAEFLKGLKTLTLLRHANLIGLKGFCYSRARGECFLIYDFVANGSLSEYLDVKSDEIHKVVLEWAMKVSIIKGIAKGIEYLHSNRTNKPSLLHQNLSATNVLIDHQFNPLLSGSGLHKLLADDVVFSSIKTSAAMGYLAPEYTTVGRFTEKSDVYAFGVIVFQILTGKTRITQLRLEAESGKLEDLIDENLQGNYSKPEAAKLAGIALLCTSEIPNQRPTMEAVLQELNSSSRSSSRSSSCRSKN